MITESCAIQSWMAIDHCPSFAQSNKDIKHGVVLPVGVPVINPSDILQKWITKKRKWPTKIKVQQRKANTESATQI